MIYLDNCATTAVDARVLERMLPFFSQEYGNPSSQHYVLAREAREACNMALSQLGELIGAGPEEIVATSGATEAINLGIRGAFHAYRAKGKHLVTIKTEHKAVLDCIRALRYEGAEVTELDVLPSGLLDPEVLAGAIRKDSVLVAAMWVNNETGVIQNMTEIAAICRERNTLLFCDATQAVGKLPADMQQVRASLMAFSAHKMHGPKGAGALYIRGSEPRVQIRPQILGGGHQGGMRSGTLNVPALVGFGEACAIARDRLETEAGEMRRLQSILENEMQSAFPQMQVNGFSAPRVGHISNICLPGIRNERLLQACSEVLAFSAGSACTAADPEPSHVLQAMGLDIDKTRASFRISMGRYNTPEQILKACEILKGKIKALME